MGIGALIINEHGEVIAEHSSYVPKNWQNSNNVAEYMGFCWLMDTLIALIETRKEQETDFKPQISIKGDSQLVVRQMCGEWKIKAGRYVKHAYKAKEALGKLYPLCNGVEIDWIPRELNNRADVLSKGELVKNNVQFRIQPQ